jgi:hypothetical protein
MGREEVGRRSGKGGKGSGMGGEGMDALGPGPQNFWARTATGYFVIASIFLFNMLKVNNADCAIFMLLIYSFKKYAAQIIYIVMKKFLLNFNLVCAINEWSCH